VTDNITPPIRESYDRLADEYARRIFNELQHKPLDRQLLNRFAAEIAGRGEICDMGCGPGHVARYLRDVGATVFGLDIAPRMVEQARHLNPDISFREGNMMALDIPDRTLAGIAAFYAIVNIPSVSAVGVSGNAEGTATGRAAVTCISHWRRSPSRRGVVGSAYFNGFLSLSTAGNSTLLRGCGLRNRRGNRARALRPGSRVTEPKSVHLCTEGGLAITKQVPIAVLGIDINVAQRDLLYSNSGIPKKRPIFPVR